MKKITIFIKNLIKNFISNDLLSMANELTYKLLIAIFPLLIYLINIFAFLGIKYDVLSSNLQNTLPDTVIMVLTDFLNSVKPFAESENVWSVMNLTLLFAILSSSSGFYTVIRGINRTYNVKDERSLIVQRLLSIYLVIQFSITMALSSLLMVFGDSIMNFINHFTVETIVIADSFGTRIFNIASIILVLLNVMLTYKIGSYKKISLISTFPGALITVFAWLASSELFNIYINNFSKYNAVYGTIGTMLIFILWINIISIVLLVGSQINAQIYEQKASSISKNSKM